MKPFAKPSSACMAAALAAGAVLFVPGPVRAQPPAVGAPPAPPAATPAGPSAADTLARMGQAAGVLVVADSSVANERVGAPDSVAVTSENLEAQLAEIVKTLPRGTQWARVYLPASPNSRKWTGDAVADFVYAQSKLFGNVGGATPPGTVEILGQRVSTEKAGDMIASLNLKPVYLITNPTRRQNAAAAAGTMDPAQWANMTPQQQQQYAEQQAQQLLNMDPNQRQQLMQQQMSIMRSMMQQMTPEQRQQMFQGMRGGFGGPGGPGGFGGRRRGGAGDGNNF